jgi:hypothetical protein
MTVRDAVTVGIVADPFLLLDEVELGEMKLGH